MSRNVLVALLGAALMVAPGATGALAAPSVAPERVEAAQAQAERLAPELAELAEQVQGALAGLEGKAAALADETPDEGQPGCELNEASRSAALDELRTTADRIERRFGTASGEIIASLQAAVERFVAELKAADAVAQARAAFQDLQAALGTAADAGAATVEEAGSGVSTARDAAIEALRAACAPAAQVEEVDDESKAVLDLLAQADATLEASLPDVLVQFDQARRAILASMAADDGDGGEDNGEGRQEQTATTTTTLVADGGDGGGDHGALPFTGATVLPLLVFGIVVAGVGGLLVVTSRRSTGV